MLCFARIAGRGRAATAPRAEATNSRGGALTMPPAFRFWRFFVCV